MTLFVIGLLGAFLSGLLGVGGAIVMIPMLLYIPPLLGDAPFNMVTVSAMTIVQVLAASTAGLLAHRRAGHFSWTVAVPMGLAIGIGAALGGVMAAWTSERLLQGTFALLAVVASILMIVPTRNADDGDSVPPGFKPWLAGGLAGGVGVLSGMVGAGGAFLLAPMMRMVLHLPIRLVIGTSLGIVFVSAVAGTAAKALTGQIPWEATTLLVVGALVGAPLGAKVSHRVPAAGLRWGLAVAIGLTALNMVIQVWGWAPGGS